jgi:hypothetical protein
MPRRTGMAAMFASSKWKIWLLSVARANSFRDSARSLSSMSLSRRAISAADALLAARSAASPSSFRRMVRISRYRS